MRLVGYVTVTKMTFDKQSNADEIPSYTAVHLGPYYEMAPSVRLSVRQSHLHSCYRSITVGHEKLQI